MIDGYFIATTIGSIVSLLLLLLIHNEVRHISDSQIYVVGRGNRDLVSRMTTKIFTIFYFIVTISLIVFAYYIIYSF